MEYGDLIGEAFRVAWRNRYLWFFGFFISGGVGSLKISIPPNPESAGDYPTWLPGQWARENVAALHAGERRSFAQTWRAGTRNVWRVFLYVVLFSLIGLVPVLLIGGPVALGIFGTISVADSELLQVLFITLIVPAALALLLVVYIPLYLVQQLALRELVIGGRGIVASVGGGYRILRRNPGRTMAVWLVQFVIALTVLVVLYFVGAMIGLAQTFGFLALSYSAPYPLALVLAVVTGLIVSLPFVVVAAFIGVYNHAYWTLAYQRLVALSTDPLPTAGHDGPTID